MLHFENQIYCCVWVSKTHRSLPVLSHTWLHNICTCEASHIKCIFCQVCCIIKYSWLRCLVKLVLFCVGHWRNLFGSAFLFKKPANPVFLRQWRWYPWMCGAKEIRNRSFCRSSCHFSQLLPSTWPKFSLARREGTSVSCKGKSQRGDEQGHALSEADRISLAVVCRHRICVSSPQSCF